MSIKLNRKGAGLAGEDRVKENQNLEMIEQEFNSLDSIKEDSAAAKLSALEALAKADAADSLSKNVQTQLNTVVVEGDSSPQAEQASVGARGEDYGGNLKARLDAEYNAVTTQLADKAEQADLLVQAGRIDVLSELPDGSTTNDARLEDIRVGVNGVTYATPAESVREQVKYALETKLIKLSGIGGQGAGTSGVTKNGDIYFNNEVNKLYKATNYVNSTTFTGVEVPILPGAVYTFNDDLYLYNGTKIESVIKSRLIKLVGMGSMGAGTSGVTKVGDVYFNTISNEILRCISFVSTTNFVAVKVPFVEGAIYTFNNDFYLYNGTTLVSRTKELADQVTRNENKLIKLAGIGGQSAGTSGVTKVGDIYFNTSSNKLLKCTAFTSLTSFSVVDVPMLSGAIYTFGSSLYIYDGTTLVSTDKLFKLVGKGSIFNGTSGVTKNGDIFWNESTDKLLRAVDYVSPTSFKTVEVPYIRGAIYTLGNKLYVYNGTELELAGSTNTLYELVGMGSMFNRTSGVKKVGDSYYNVGAKAIFRCTSFVSETNFTTEVVPFEDVIYTIGNELYIYNGEELVATAPRAKTVSKAVPDDVVTSLINGIKFSDELQNPLTNFSKAGDNMVHTSSFVIHNDIVYAIFMVNYDTGGEMPSQMDIRFHSCPLSDPTNITYYDVSNIGDVHAGKTITHIYDAAIFLKDGTPYLLWNVRFEGESYYTMLYNTFDTATSTLSAIDICTFKAGNTERLLTGEGINQALDAEGINHPFFDAHIVLMPKISTRVENGTTYYYTGIGTESDFNCIVKTADFINWVYVAQPSFKNKAKYEPVVYVLGDKAFYFCRQAPTEKDGFLTVYDIVKDTWELPVYIDDTQSRPDFIYHNSKLYLIKAPKDRNHISVMLIDQQNLDKSYEVQVAKVPDYFYPIAQEYNGTLYMLFTQSRLNIYLSEFTIGSISSDSVLAKFKELFLV